MSVVNLERRMTNLEGDFQTNKSSQSSLLFVGANPSVERFSLDLTVGSAWAKSFSPTQRKFVRIEEDGIRIGRHDSIVIEIAEDLRVPNNMYGILVPTGSLFLGLGILIAPAKIEPGYEGKLKLRLFNTTSEKHVLKKGHKLGSAIFFSTETTVHHSKITQDRHVSELKLGVVSKCGFWIKRHWVTLSGYLLALIVGGFQLVPYFWPRSISSTNSISDQTVANEKKTAASAPAPTNPASSPKNNKD